MWEAAAAALSRRRRLLLRSRRSPRPRARPPRSLLLRGTGPRSTRRRGRRAGACRAGWVVVVEVGVEELREREKKVFLFVSSFLLFTVFGFCFKKVSASASSSSPCDHHRDCRGASCASCACPSCPFCACCCCGVSFSSSFLRRASENESESEKKKKRAKQRRREESGCFGGASRPCLCSCSCFGPCGESENGNESARACWARAGIRRRHRRCRRCFACRCSSRSSSPGTSGSASSPRLPRAVAAAAAADVAAAAAVRWARAAGVV